MKIINFYKLLVHKKYTTLAGTISFFLIVNGGAFLYLVFYIMRFLNIDFALSDSLFPNSVISIINYFQNNNKMSIIFSITLIWGSSNLFYHILKTGEIIYEKKRERGKILNRVLAIIAIILFLALVFLVLVFFIISEIVLEYVVFSPAKIFLKYFTYMIIPFVLLSFINIYIPPMKVRFKSTIWGSLFTSIYWFLSTYFFNFFLKYFSSYNEIYGSLAFLIILMMWVYILVNGMIIGFIINYQRMKNDLNVDNINGRKI